MSRHMPSINAGFNMSVMMFERVGENQRDECM
jgi:hypothetical protein